MVIVFSQGQDDGCVVIIIMSVANAGAVHTAGAPYADFFHLILFFFLIGFLAQSYEAGILITPISQMRKWRHLTYSSAFFLSLSFGKALMPPTSPSLRFLFLLAVGLSRFPRTDCMFCLDRV